MGTIGNLVTPYTSVRGYITRSMIMVREEIEDLASTRSTREMWEALKETLLGSYLSENVPSNEAAFRTEMIGLLHQLFSSIARVLNKEKRKYLSVFLLELDIDILKSVTHQWVDGGLARDTTSIPRSPLFTREVIDRIASARHPMSFQEALPLPNWTTEGLARLLAESAEAKPSLRMTKIYWRLDSRYYQHLWKNADKFASERASLRKALGLRIDLVNLERIIRGRVRGIPTGELRKNLIDVSCGISREELNRAIEAETLEAVKSALDTSPYADLLESRISTFSEEGKLERISEVFNKFEVKALKKLVTMDPLPLTAVNNFSLAMLASLLRLVMMQIKVLERIFRARIQSLGKEQTLDLVAFFDF